MNTIGKPSIECTIAHSLTEKVELIATNIPVKEQTQLHRPEMELVLHSIPRWVDTTPRMPKGHIRPYKYHK